MLEKYDRYEPKDYVIIEPTKDNCSMPRRATQMSVGYDLFATKDEVIRPLDRKLIGTGIKLKMPEGMEYLLLLLPTPAAEEDLRFPVEEDPLLLLLPRLLLLSGRRGSSSSRGRISTSRRRCEVAPLGQIALV